MSYYKYKKINVKTKFTKFYYCYMTVEMTLLQKLFLQFFYFV